MNPITSTKRDAIITFLGLLTPKARILLTSLRSVNPRCSIIAMFSMKPLLPEDILYLCIDLKITLYSCSLNDSRFDKAPHLLRYFAYS